MRFVNWACGVVGSATEAVGESWPLLLMGFLGGAMVIGGLIALIRCQ